MLDASGNVLKTDNKEFSSETAFQPYRLTAETTAATTVYLAVKREKSSFMVQSITVAPPAN